MDKTLPNINPSAEVIKITSFIKRVLKEQEFRNVIIGVSGGVDSATCLSLLIQSLKPENIFIVHLHYFDSQIKNIESILKQARIPKENIYNLSIRKPVDGFIKLLKIPKQVRNDNERVRLGNIMARVRMIILYDLAKKHNALVCGTENKSELQLGYFTRFGDEASDFEPIQHLYKTQVYQLAKYLGVVQDIIDLPPTAGLWTGQTDENDFGFSYKEADNVLFLYFEKKNSLLEISKEFPNAKKIIDRARKNSFKHHLPYTVTP